MGKDPDSPPKWIRPLPAGREWAGVLLLAVAYALTGLLGAWPVDPGVPAAVFWPSAGVAMAGLIRGGLRLWPGVVAGAAAANLVAGMPAGAAVVLAFGSGAGAVLGANLVRRSGGRPTLDRLSDVAVLGLGAAAAAAAAAVVGPVGLWAAGVIPAAGVPHAALVWLVGDGLGVLLVAPAVLAATRGGLRRPAWSAAEAALTAAGLAVVAGLAFGVSGPGLPRLPAVTAGLPLGAWAAVRFGPRGAAFANLVVAAGLLALMGGDPVGVNHLPVALFVAVAAATALCLGAVTAERDEALRATAASREEYRRIVETAQEGVLTTGPDGRVTYANRRMADLLGADPDRLVGRPALDLIDPADRPAAEARLEARRQGVPGQSEVRMLRADGRPVWVQISSNPLYDPAGRLLGVLAMAADLSDRKAAEAEVAAGRERFRALFEHAPVAIWECDLTGFVARLAQLRADGAADRLLRDPAEADRAAGLIGVRDANRAAVATSGAGDKADLLVRFGRLFTPVTLAALAAELAGLAEGRRTFRVEARAARLTGDPADLILHLAVPDEGGRPDLSRVVLIALDVTGQKRLEEQFRQAQKMDAVGRLAGGIAHDFNNLLTVIMGYGEVLGRLLPAGSRERDVARQIVDAGQRAADLTRQLLAFSRRQPVHPTALDVSAVVRGMEPLLGRLIGEDVRLETRLAAGLPAIRADRGHVQQVVMNLAVNARDAMPGGGTLTIATDHAEVAGGNPPGPGDVPAGRYAVLAVSDTGHGIPDEVRQHLFEPFFTTKEVGRGTGLGLATVFGIVTQAGGHVRFETAPDRGTTFRVYFPVSGPAVLPPAEAAAPRPEPVEPPEAPTAPAGDAGRLLPAVWADLAAGVPTDPTDPAQPTVLLVEDEPAIRALASRILTGIGFHVIAAGSGAEALDRLAGRSPSRTPSPKGTLSLPGVAPRVDVLVTDVVMPGMGGRELAERVKVACPGVKVVFISGYNPDRTPAARPGPGEAFLPKPFTPDELTRTVRDMAGDAAPPS